MNGYELSKKWFDFSIDNASLIKPAHGALFFFCIEHNNRLGWKKEFGLPRQLAMDAIGIKNNRTFTKAFNDLAEWGFLEIKERSSNQYSANIISLNGCVKNTPATTKATQKHSHKHCTGIAPINKLINKETNILDHDPQKLQSFTNPNGIYFSIQTDKDFLKMWKYIREAILKKPTNANILSYSSKANFEQLKKHYNVKEFIDALNAFFSGMDKNFTSLGAEYFLRPENFERYLNAKKGGYKPHPEKNKKISEKL